MGRTRARPCARGGGRGARGGCVGPALPQWKNGAKTASRPPAPQGRVWGASTPHAQVSHHPLSPWGCGGAHACAVVCPARAVRARKQAARKRCAEVDDVPAPAASGSTGHSGRSSGAPSRMSCVDRACEGAGTGMTVELPRGRTAYPSSAHTWVFSSVLTRLFVAVGAPVCLRVRRPPDKRLAGAAACITASVRLHGTREPARACKKHRKGAACDSVVRCLGAGVSCRMHPAPAALHPVMVSQPIL